MRDRKKQKKNNSSQTNNDDNNDDNKDDTPKRLIDLITSSIIDNSFNDDDFLNYRNNKEEEEEEEEEDDSLWPTKEINKEIKTIDDLIELGEMYDPKVKVKYNIDLKKLSKLVTPLNNLKKMIGLDNIKQNIVGHITYYLANLEDTSSDMMHTVITGPPGVGKTELGKILGDIYYNLGVLQGNKKRKRFSAKDDSYTFKIIKRSDLIGKYLGHTAIKTQEVIDSCDGGVLFIDEAYSLGNPEGRDSFSKECIDTINQNLTEKKTNFLCIIAGYKDALDKCFFSYNEGLSRRFTFRYNIEKYTTDELKLIFYKMVNNLGWEVKLDNLDTSFFKENYSSFTNMAGDIETLLFNCKIAHGKRVFCKPKEKKKITITDIKEGFKIFNENRGNNEDKNETWKYLYT